MSINDLADYIEDIALRAILKSGAAEYCSRHSDVLVSSGDPDAEKRAYAIATNELKASSEMEFREDVMSAVKSQLDLAAEDECPQ